MTSEKSVYIGFAWRKHKRKQTTGLFNERKGLSHVKTRELDLQEKRKSKDLTWKKKKKNLT